MEGSMQQSCALLVLLVVGMSSAKHLNHHGNDDTFQPIVSASQSRRICAALCISGLGGKPCGDNCLDITPSPSKLPVQSTNKSRENNGAAGTSMTSLARTEFCPVLCANKLGYPLCDCDETSTVNAEIDFVQICGNLCVEFDYHLYGCQSCEVYKEEAKTNPVEFSSTAVDRKVKSVDWEEWCRQMCSVGDGGAACNCDILPMNIVMP